MIESRQCYRKFLSSNLELTLTGIKALIINDHMVVNAIKRDFHKNDLCWTVNDNDVDTLLSNV